MRYPDNPPDKSGMERMSQTKKQHFVPSSYLKGFANREAPDRFWVYSKDGQGTRYASPVNEGYKKYTYAVSMPDGNTDTQTVEKWLSGIDGMGISIIRKIGKCNSISLSSDERAKLSSYIGMLFLRNPVALKNVEVMHEMIMHAKGKEDAAKEGHIEDVVRTANPDSNEEEIDSLVSGVKDILMKCDYSFEYPKGYSLRIFETATEFARMLAEMRWVFVHCRGSGFFVTSDNPVFFGHPDPESGFMMYGGLGQPNAILTVPITRSMALLADWKISRSMTSLVRGSEKDIRRVNSHTIGIANRFIYSPFKSNRIGKEAARRRQDSVLLTPDNELMGSLINQLLKEN